MAVLAKCARAGDLRFAKSALASRFAVRGQTGRAYRRPFCVRDYFTVEIAMSRLAEAQAKLEDALRQLEAALANRPLDVKSHAIGTDHIVDRAAIIAEIGRIDEQLTSAMQIIDRVRHASGTEGGTA